MEPELSSADFVGKIETNMCADKQMETSIALAHQDNRTNLFA